MLRSVAYSMSVFDAILTSQVADQVKGAISLPPVDLRLPSSPNSNDSNDLSGAREEKDGPDGDRTSDIEPARQCISSMIQSLISHGDRHPPAVNHFTWPDISSITNYLISRIHFSAILPNLSKHSLIANPNFSFSLGPDQTFKISQYPFAYHLFSPHTTSQFSQLSIPEQPPPPTYNNFSETNDSNHWNDPVGIRKEKRGTGRGSNFGHRAYQTRYGVNFLMVTVTRRLWTISPDQIASQLQNL
jgi:hypothetical protein